MRVQTAIGSLLLTLLLLAPAQAGLRHYEARIDKAQWKNSASRLLCSLSQDIPEFGKARFSARNGKEIQIGFELSSQRRDIAAGSKMLWSNWAPAWQPMARDEARDTLSSKSAAMPVMLNHAQAMRVLADLEQGRLPTFALDESPDGERISVSVSAVRFGEALNKFRDCMNQLLPYSFADISRSTVNFKFDTTEPTDAGAERLRQIRDYLTADKDIEFMLVEGHTDNQGGRWMNQQLGMKRAEWVRDYLLQSGVEAARIKLKSEGERKPLASNKTESGRAQNRRVVIQISR